MKASGEKQEGTRHVWRTTQKKKRLPGKYFPHFHLNAVIELKIVM